MHDYSFLALVHFGIGPTRTRHTMHKNINISFWLNKDLIQQNLFIVFQKS